MADSVILKLAHPLSAKQVARLRAAETGDLNIGDTITVPRDEALGIINSGYAMNIDPGDRDAVEEAMSPPFEPGEGAAAATAPNSTPPADGPPQDPAGASGKAAAKKTDGGR